jgi:hypothetical protein
MLSFSEMTKSFHGGMYFVGKCRPQSDHVERGDLAKRFFIAGWERERATRWRERGRGLNTPQ